MPKYSNDNSKAVVIVNEGADERDIPTRDRLPADLAFVLAWRDKNARRLAQLDRAQRLLAELRAA